MFALRRKCFLSQLEAIQIKRDSFWLIYYKWWNSSAPPLCHAFECLFKICFHNLILISNNFKFSLKWFFSENDDCWGWCSGIGFIIILTCLTYLTLLYYFFVKPFCLKKCEASSGKQFQDISTFLHKNRWTRIVISMAAFSIGNNDSSFPRYVFARFIFLL